MYLFVAHCLHCCSYLYIVQLQSVLVDLSSLLNDSNHKKPEFIQNKNIYKNIGQTAQQTQISFIGTLWLDIVLFCARICFLQCYLLLLYDTYNMYVSPKQHIL